MRYYLGFDDTDTLESDYGTGKVARWFEPLLPAGFRLAGVVRQQLLVHPGVPYTSHNSGACLIIEDESGFGQGKDLQKAAAAHLESCALEGSDPGFCLAGETEAAGPEVIHFGRSCTSQVMNQDMAMDTARKNGIHLSAHGGTGDGIIGALACVGLTAWGWSGRFIEMGGLRGLPDKIEVAMLHEQGILVTSIDRDAPVPAARDMVDTHGWCRPRLMGGRPVLLVNRHEGGHWHSLGRKRTKQGGHAQLS